MKDTSFEAVVKTFRSTVPMQRRAAIASLAAFGERSFPLLAEALADENAGVRDAAWQAFSRFESASAAPHLIPLLGHPEIEIRNMAAELLISHGSKAVSALLAVREHPDHDVRKFVIDILGLSRDERAVGGLIAALDDPDENVVVSAAEGLGNLAAAAAVPALCAKYRASEGMPAVVLTSLGKIDTPEARHFLLERFRDADLAELLIALEALRTTTHSPIAAQLAALLHSLPGEVTQEAVKTILIIMSRHGRPAREAIDLEAWAELVVGVIEEADHETLCQVLPAIDGQFVEAHTLEIAKLLNHPDEKVRLLGQDKLGMVAPCRIAGGAARILPVLQDAGKLLYLQLLASCASSECLAVCQSLLAACSAEIKEAMARLLGEMDSQESRRLLVALAKEEDESISQAAIISLSRHVAPDLVPVFLEGIKSGNETIRAYCVFGLANNSIEALGEAINELLASNEPDDMEFGLSIILQLPQLGNDAEIVRLLSHPSPRVRILAVRALGNAALEDAIQEVQLMMSDADREVRLAALDTLLQLAPERRKLFLEAALMDTDPWVQTRALAVIGDKRLAALAAQILPLTLVSNEKLRDKAIQTFLAIGGAGAETELQQYLAAHEGKPHDIDEMARVERDGKS